MNFYSEKRMVPRIVLAVLVLASVFGVGGAKLAGARGAAAQVFTQGEKGQSYSMSSDLQARTAAAANLLTIAGQLELDAGALEICEQARADLEQTDAAIGRGAGPAELYQLDMAMAGSVDLLYQTMKPAAEAADKAQVAQTQYSEFLSRAEIMATSDYNDIVAEFNKTRAAFPANLIAAVTGVDPVEQFAKARTD